jgi:hypothetical protein
VNNVGRPENRREKRLLDIVLSLFFLLFCWLLIWFQKNKLNFLPNIFRVLFGIYSWVGYGKTLRRDLPALRPSVLTPAGSLPEPVSEERVNKALLNYSKDYKMENDLKIIYRQWRGLGN